MQSIALPICVVTPCRHAAHEGRDGEGKFRPSRLTFVPIEPNVLDDVVVAEGYDSEVLIRWGDPLTYDAPEFDFCAQTPQAQAEQFGYNCDFIGLLPLRDDQSVLWVNHEFPNSPLMFPDFDPEAPTEQQVNIQRAALGGSVVVIERVGRGRYRYIRGHRLNRRISMETPIVLTGPAAGSPLLRTSEDPTGTSVRGSFMNCGGGVTPWGTILTGEENVNLHFGNLAGVTDPLIRAFHQRMGFLEGPSTARWELYDPRFDLGREPNEAFRFGWVVEVDPFDPCSTPCKRTALGRFKHEDANVRINPDGRVTVYLGDDDFFEYIYKFVTTGRIQDKNPDLLDDGVLYVARFDVDEDGCGIGEWLPLVHGERGLTTENGFASQAEVLVNTRGAADIVGATPMDRPEDVEASPFTGAVYIALTSNLLRGAPGRPGPDPANPRQQHPGGHVIELVEGGDTERFKWQIFLLCGDPDDPSTYFAGFPKDQVSPIAGPDNFAFDAGGNLWIATDGQQRALGFNDAFHAVPVIGPDRGHVRMFASVPPGAEATGPFFSPDGQTLFGSVQHPGEGGSLQNPTSRWPDRTLPSRPSVVTFRRACDDSRVGA